LAHTDAGWFGPYRDGEGPDQSFRGFPMLPAGARVGGKIMGGVIDPVGDLRLVGMEVRFRAS